MSLIARHHGKLNWAGGGLLEKGRDAADRGEQARDLADDDVLGARAKRGFGGQRRLVGKAAARDQQPGAFGRRGGEGQQRLARWQLARRGRGNGAAVEAGR